MSAGGGRAVLAVCLLVVLAACTGGGSTAAAPSATAAPPPPSPSESVDPTADLRVERESRPLPPSDVRIAPQVVSEVRGAGAPAGSATASQVTASQATQVERTLSELGAQRTPDGLVVTLPERVLFAFDEAEIQPAAEPTLRQIGEVLAYYQDTTVDVRGHTDSRGAEDYNQRLSQERAEAVRDALVSRYGVDSSRLEVQALGEREPVAPNEHPDGSDNPDGRQQNRRVEVVILQA